MVVKEIVTDLRCAYHTVVQHTKNVFLKLGVSSRGGLAARLLGPLPSDATGEAPNRASSRERGIPHELTPAYATDITASMARVLEEQRGIRCFRRAVAGWEA
jgi:hypothetical protein